MPEARSGKVQPSPTGTTRNIEAYRVFFSPLLNVQSVVIQSPDVPGRILTVYCVFTWYVKLKP